MANFVNLGNDKLNINTSTAKGLEKVIGVIATFIINAQSSIGKIFYGKFKLQNDPNANKIQKALDKGLTNILGDLVGINYCQIVEYLTSQIPGGKPFDPNNKPSPDEPLARSKWAIQYAAFTVQRTIDTFYSQYGNVNTPESRLGLYTLIQEVNNIFSTVLGPEDGLNDPEITSAFPQTSVITNFLQDVLNKFNQYQSVNDINQAELQKLLRIVEKVKATCQAIIALNSPADILNLANNLSGGAVQEQLATLNKIIDVPRFLPLVRQIIRTANNINSVGRKLIGYINFGRVIIKTCIALIKIYNVIKSFFLALPIPSVTTTVGVSTKFSDIYQSQLKEQGEKKFIKRLNQINAVLNLMAICVTSILAGIDDIIGKLNILRLNLESCSPDIAEEIKQTVSNLESTRSELKSFLDGYNSTGEKINRQFGEYTIEIVTEQLADEGVSIKRRFGIARNSSGYISVQSTPTFASLDLIIINEVKTLLISKGLVSFNLSSISSEDSLTVLESLRFLGSEDLSLDSVQVNLQDLASVKDQTDAVGLTNFVNNLPGGRALRKKIQQQMAEESSKLKENLAGTDPLGRFTSSI